MLSARTPKLSVALHCGSVSARHAEYPNSAKPALIATADDVLPQPPFWFTRAMTCVFGNRISTVCLYRGKRTIRKDRPPNVCLYGGTLPNGALKCISDRTLALFAFCVTNVIRRSPASETAIDRRSSISEALRSLDAFPRSGPVGDRDFGH